MQCMPNFDGEYFAFFGVLNYLVSECHIRFQLIHIRVGYDH